MWADLGGFTELAYRQELVGMRVGQSLRLGGVVRTAPRPAASLALRAAGVALPPTVRLLADA